MKNYNTIEVEVGDTLYWVKRNGMIEEITVDKRHLWNNTDKRPLFRIYNYDPWVPIVDIGIVDTTLKSKTDRVSLKRIEIGYEGSGMGGHPVLNLLNIYKYDIAVFIDKETAEKYAQKIKNKLKNEDHVGTITKLLMDDAVSNWPLIHLDGPFNLKEFNKFIEQVKSAEEYGPVHTIVETEKNSYSLDEFIDKYIKK